MHVWFLIRLQSIPYSILLVLKITNLLSITESRPLLNQLEKMKLAYAPAGAKAQADVFQKYHKLLKHRRTKIESQSTTAQMED